MHDPYSAPTCETTAMNSTTAPRVLPWPLPAGTRCRAHCFATAAAPAAWPPHGVQLPDGTQRHFAPVAAPRQPLPSRTGTCAARPSSGDIGFAESYIAGDWTTPHLTDLLKLLIANRQQVEGVIYGTWAGRLLYRIKHLLNRNTKANSQKNIHAHYDLGNAFYELWLDDTMNYSSAWFEGDAGGDMRTAQLAKVRRALRMAGVQPGDRVLEIGCGWGALAEMATTEFGATLTGVTLSTEQLAFARKRMAQHGVAGQADLRLQDYRDISDGPYDAICSIEMVEAVGRILAHVLCLHQAPAQARWQGLHPEHRDRRRAVQALHQLHRFHPAVHLPRRLPALPTRIPPRGRGRRPARGGRVRLWADYAETLKRWRERFLAQRAEI